MRPSPTIRLRLTLWYGGLFLLAGALLLAANYALVARNFPSGGADVREAVAGRLGLAPEELRGGRVIPVEFRDPGGRRGFPFSDLFEGVGAELRADTLEQLGIQSAAALGAMAVVSMALGWFVAGRMLRPLHDISSTVRRISDQNLAERVALEGPADELKELADQFDVMLARLERSFDAQRTFVANASHELRTPLTIIRTELDVTLAGGSATREELAEMSAVVHRAIDRTERLIDQLLVLAAADEPVRRTEQIDLSETVRRTLDAHAGEFEQLDLRRELSLAAVTVRGDRALLDRLVGNLVENAIQHNKAGGRVSVVTSASPEGATFQIANDGGEIVPEQVPGLFERFARLDRSRSRGTGGYGLGLSIVRAIARAHGGEAQARARPEGGLEVTVTLPA